MSITTYPTKLGIFQNGCISVTLGSDSATISYQKLFYDKKMHHAFVFSKIVIVLINW